MQSIIEVKESLPENKTSEFQFIAYYFQSTFENEISAFLRHANYENFCPKNPTDLSY